MATSDLGFFNKQYSSNSERRLVDTKRLIVTDQVQFTVSPSSMSGISADSLQTTAPDPVDVSTSAPPVVSQLLTAVTPTSASWQTHSNSNLGTGVDVFKQTVGTTSEFRTIIGGSNLTATENVNDITLVLDDPTTLSDLTVSTLLQATGTTESTSTTTGAVTVSGGIGVAKNVTVGGRINVDNIQLENNIISSIDTNGDISLMPNGSGEVLLKADPVSSTGAATKNYVDSVAQGLDIKESCIVKTDALLVYIAAGSGIGKTLTNNGASVALSIDGTLMTLNNRVLFDTGATGNVSDVDHGIYNVTTVGDGATAWVLTRSIDADESSEVTAGMFTFITGGSTFSETGWTLVTPDPITIDTTPLQFIQFTGAGTTTGSNVGAGGVGVFKQLTGSTLEFNNIQAGSSKIKVALDGANNEVDVDVDETSLTLSNQIGPLSLAKGGTANPAAPVSGNLVVARTATTSTWKSPTREIFMPFYTQFLSAVGHNSAASVVGTHAFVIVTTTNVANLDFRVPEDFGTYVSASVVGFREALFSSITLTANFGKPGELRTAHTATVIGLAIPIGLVGLMWKLDITTLFSAVEAEDVVGVEVKSTLITGGIVGISFIYRPDYDN